MASVATANATAAVRVRAIGGLGSCRASSRVTAARPASRVRTATRWTSRRPVSRAEAIVDRSAAAAEEAAAAASPTSRRALGFENDDDRVKSALETNVAGADAERPEKTPVSVLAQEAGLVVDASAAPAAGSYGSGGLCYLPRLGCGAPGDEASGAHERHPLPRSSRAVAVRWGGWRRALWHVGRLQCPPCAPWKEPVPL